MANTIPWQMLFVDDDIEICEQAKEYLESENITDSGERPEVEICNDFTKALEALEARRFDLLVLDVRLGPHDESREEEAGIMTLDAIRQRRFVPIVFYTGLPNLVRHMETSLVRVVEKTEGLPHLLETAKNIFATRMPSINRALVRHLEIVQRDYMWDFVAKNWEKFGDTSDSTALAYLLARRLAMSLSGPGIKQLTRDLGGSGRVPSVDGQVHPMQYYVLPPVDPAPLASDLYQGQIGERRGYWVLLTPSCDLVTGREKAEWVLLASCFPLSEQEEYQIWQTELPEPSKSKTNRLKDLLKNNRQKSQPERFYFLPGALTLPDLIVDFQQLVTLQRDQMDSMERLASLDSPFAEALLARFARYFGRVGTPDLDLEIIIRSLTD